MANDFTAKLDTTEWDKAFSQLDGPVKESLMRRMLVEGGVLLRDAAKSNAMMAANKQNEPVRGVLAKSIYLVYDKEAEQPNVFTYKISWNARRAPHGHLIEFGHWMTHAVYRGTNGEWYTDKDRPLDTPVWIAARSFLRPTIESYGNVAIRAMILRGQRELPEILKEHIDAAGK